MTDRDDVLSPIDPADNPMAEDIAEILITKQELEARIAALGAQHRALEQAWRELRRGLEGMCLGTARELDACEVQRLVDLYRSHIGREEEELLPLAARSLDTAQLDRVGRAMRLRRGIKEI